eukprot:4553658-Amphidinium_carterae.1
MCITSSGGSCEPPAQTLPQKRSNGGNSTHRSAAMGATQLTCLVHLMMTKTQRGTYNPTEIFKLLSGAEWVPPQQRVPLAFPPRNWS